MLTYRVTFSFLAALILVGATDLPAQSGGLASADSVAIDSPKRHYRPIGFSIGILHNRVSGTGNRLLYIEETDSYDATRLSGKGVLGFTIGVYTWRQRTHLQLEVGWSRREFLEEGGFRSTTNGGTVDTYIDIGYFVGGFRLKQALFTRRLLITGGISVVEEGRKRQAKTKSNGQFVESNSFPTDNFYLWSIGLDLKIAPAIYLGYSYYRTYNQDDYGPLYGRINDPPIIVDGFTMHSFQLTLVY